MPVCLSVIFLFLVDLHTSVSSQITPPRHKNGRCFVYETLLPYLTDTPLTELMRINCLPNTPPQSDDAPPLPPAPEAKQGDEAKGAVQKLLAEQTHIRTVNYRSRPLNGDSTGFQCLTEALMLVTRRHGYSVAQSDALDVMIRWQLCRFAFHDLKSTAALTHAHRHILHTAVDDLNASAGALALQVSFTQRTSLV